VYNFWSPGQRWPGSWIHVPRGKIQILKQALRFFTIFRGWPASCLTRRAWRMQIRPVDQRFLNFFWSHTIGGPCIFTAYHL